MTKQNPVVVITGASSGIGRATALAFAEKGARLVLAARGLGPLEEVVAECERAGAEAIAVPADVTDEQAVRSIANTAVDRFGRIDVWINDAATGIFGPFIGADMNDFRRVLDVDVMGTVYGSRAALEVMDEQGEGVIINIASIVGAVPQPYTAAYGMAKAAVRALGVSLRSELSLARRWRIHVCTVLPPTIDTPFFAHAPNFSGRKVRAMPPVYPPDKVARAIVGLASVPRSEVVVGGMGKTFVRLHRMAPRAIEAQMAVQVETAHLSRNESAPDTKGNLYDTSSPVGVTGGWNGARRLRRRKVIGVALLAGGAGILARRLTRP